jgi:surface polysaccharide O-acyltransferase-like enzyme
MSTPSSFADAPPARPRRAADDSLAWISWLRVVAIAAVVCIHVGGATAAAPGARASTAGRLGIVLDFGSRWSVPVFVMVSGALLLDPARYRGAVDFWRRRALRLVPAVIVWHLVYLVYVEAHDGPIGAREIVERVLTGRLYTALYFFWIVIGLAAITPVLMPWLSSVSRRVVLPVAVLAIAVPALNVVTAPLRSDASWVADQAWVRTPWTWWLLYLGYFLLGHALRDVVVRGWRQAGVVVVVLGTAGLLIWQWGRTDGLGGTLERYLPAEAYVGPTVAVLAAGVFLLAHGWVRPGGLLTGLCRRGPAGVARRLGDATLGVYGVHLLVFAAVRTLPGVGGQPAATSAPQLVARCVLVFAIAYLVTLLARRVPLLRRVF